MTETLVIDTETFRGAFSTYPGGALAWESPTPGAVLVLSAPSDAPLVEFAVWLADALATDPADPAARYRTFRTLTAGAVFGPGCESDDERTAVFPAVVID